MSKAAQRYIGIAHRVKKLASGEDRPTKVAIYCNGKLTEYTLDTDDHELLFLRGLFPVKFSPVDPDQDLSAVHPFHLKFKKVKQDAFNQSPKSLQQEKDGKFYVASEIATEFDGIAVGDTVASILGGSGDRFNYAIARRLQEIGGQLIRITPSRFKNLRESDSKDKDHVLLAELAYRQPELFQEITPRDMSIIKVGFYYRIRQDAMKARIGCEQRMRQRQIGKVFFGDEYPEGLIEDSFAKSKANDMILSGLKADEQRANRDLEKSLEGVDVYTELFKPIEGLGPRIAAPIIAYIGDIRRFATEAAFCSYCGVSPNAQGKFRRKRTGQVNNWNPEVRQALFQFADQMNRRPDSTWGQAFRREKERLASIHPEGINPETGKKIYTKAHIHKMACWHTLRKFCSQLYRDWTALYANDGQVESVDDKVA